MNVLYLWTIVIPTHIALILMDHSCVLVIMDIREVEFFVKVIFIFFCHCNQKDKISIKIIA
jgi:hypothetical protein